jgi:hypothetical protein
MAQKAASDSFLVHSEINSIDDRQRLSKEKPKNYSLFQNVLSLFTAGFLRFFICVHTLDTSDFLHKIFHLVSSRALTYAL